MIDPRLAQLLERSPEVQFDGQKIVIELKDVEHFTRYDHIGSTVQRIVDLHLENITKHAALVEQGRQIVEAIKAYENR